MANWQKKESGYEEKMCGYFQGTIANGYGNDFSKRSGKNVRPNGSDHITISEGERIPKLTDAITLANVLHVSLDYLSGLSEIPNSHNNKVIPLEKALEYCDKQRQMWHEYSLKALKNNNRMDSVGAVALGDRNEVMYGYEIPNILRLLCKDKEIL